MSREARAFVADGRGGGEIRTFPLPAIGDDDLLMRVEFCGIAGVDPSIFSGDHPHGRYPVVMGREAIGRVEAIGERAQRRRGLKTGDRFIVEPTIPCGICDLCFQGHYHLCRANEGYGTSRPIDRGPGLWGGFATHMAVDPRSITHKIPEEIPIERAATVASVAAAVRWLGPLARVRLGDVVLVAGATPEGIAALAVARSMGASTVLLGWERDADRFEIARALGADTIVLADAGEDPVEEILEWTGGEMADVAVACSAARGALALVLRAVKPRGRCVLSSSGWNEWVEIPRDEIPRKELKVIGAWGQAKGYRPAVRILVEGHLPVERMVTDRLGLDRAAEGIARVRTGQVGIKAVVDPSIEGAAPAEADSGGGRGEA